MSELKIQRLLASVGVIFPADRRATGAVFIPARGQAFGERFDLADIRITGTERMTWQGRKGARKFSETRQVAIESVHGNENELSVTVEGATSDALDVLTDVWRELCELDGAAPSDVREAGALVFSTVAIVELPRTYREYFPRIARARDSVCVSLGSAVATLQGIEGFRVALHFQLIVGAVQVTREFVIEPRFTSKVDDRIFFTTSPLKTDEHLRVLEEFVTPTS